MTDEQLDARVRSFLALRAEEVAEQAPREAVVAARVADRVRPSLPWLTDRWFLPSAVRLVVAFALLLLALLLLAFAASRPRTLELVNGPIAFMDGANLFVVGPDGTTARVVASAQPTDPGDDCCTVAYSRDGSHLLIATGSSIDVMNADGTGRHEVMHGGSLGGPVWSPDGRRIAVVAVAGGSTQLFVVGIDGGAPQRITDGLLYATSPAWSSDGSLIAFGGARSSMGQQALFIVAPDGTGVRQLTPELPVGSTVADTAPTWSPDDRSIAFAVGDSAGTTAAIDVVAPDGSGFRSILPDGIQGMAPAWSPDGAWIAFAGWRTGGQMADLYVVRPDGSGVRRLAQDISWVDHPWSPDGGSIAYAHGLAETIGAPSTGYADLREIQPDGSGERIVITHEVHGTIAWPPTWR